MQKILECGGHIIRFDDMDIHISMWPTHKRPVLAVSFADEPEVYKVATFNSVTTADWFLEIISDRLQRVHEYYSGLQKRSEEVSNAGQEDT